MNIKNNSIINQAHTMGDYEKIAHLRQERDYEQILDLAPHNVHNMLDLGCGTGSLLALAIKKFFTLQHVVGIDKITSRLNEAKRNITKEGIKPILLQANLTNLPKLDYNFELITMTSVLHWLHPDEELVFHEIYSVLSDEGVFLLNSYHPKPDKYNAGGTDLLVYEAFRSLGIDRKTTKELFRNKNIFSIAERTMEVSDLNLKLSKFFRIDKCIKKQAEMRVANGMEYQQYHAATFGTYYSSLIGPELEADFFEALGLIAEKRMKTYGVVTSIPVCLWRCIRNNKISNKY